MAETNILPLRFWDDPVLTTVCEVLADNEFGPKLEEFGRELIATMHAKNGIGLAAPQVGVSKRIFVMQLPDTKVSEPLVVCNPTLVLTGNNVPGREGCLSFPNFFEQVYRSAGAVMQYKTPTGEAKEIVLVEQMNARVAQHEFDHLDGIMFFDYKDKREKYVTPEYPTPRGARMSKNLYKNLMREWEKKNGKH